MSQIEREDHQEPVRWAQILTRPLELSFKNDGTVEVLAQSLVRATDKETADLAFGEFLEITGAQIVSDENVKPGKHFFSSSNWNSPWEPQGPKPPWRKPRTDPSLN